MGAETKTWKKHKKACSDSQNTNSLYLLKFSKVSYNGTCTTVPKLNGIQQYVTKNSLKPLESRNGWNVFITPRTASPVSGPCMPTLQRVHSHPLTRKEVCFRIRTFRVNEVCLFPRGVVSYDKGELARNDERPHWQSKR